MSVRRRAVSRRGEVRRPGRAFLRAAQTAAQRSDARAAGTSQSRRARTDGPCHERRREPSGEIPSLPAPRGARAGPRPARAVACEAVDQERLVAAQEIAAEAGAAALEAFASGVGAVRSKGTQHNVVTETDERIERLIAAADRRALSRRRLPGGGGHERPAVAAAG